MYDPGKCRYDVGDDASRLAEVDAAVRAVDPDAHALLDPVSGRVSVVTVMVPALLERLLRDLDTAHGTGAAEVKQGGCGRCAGCGCSSAGALSAGGVAGQA